MKILFFMLHPGYMRYYHTTVSELARRGHTIHLSFDIPAKQAKDKLDEKVSAEFPGRIIVTQTPKFVCKWFNLSRAVSWAIDYLRYLTPVFKNAFRLRKRVEVKMHPLFTKMFTQTPVFSSLPAVTAAIKIFIVFYNHIPVPSMLKKYIEKIDPDIVLVTPLVTQGSFQGDYVKASRLLGIPVAYCVASWDNLTSKGLIKGKPDKVILWNETQKNEAQTMHGINPSSIKCTGAQNFDAWFHRKPSTSRENFCRNAGLDPDKPFFLYLCSSNFMAPNETKFVTGWIEAIRGSDNPHIAQAGILIRPYPEHVKQWEQVDYTGLPNVAIWPPAGEYPLTDQSISNFYDSIYHSWAVVGINTSAMIESAIIGRPILTIMAQELNGSQSNTLHFHYLLRENGGFLLVAENLREHIRQLENIVNGDKSLHASMLDFVEKFIRPNGLKTDCVPIVADEIEKLSAITVRKSVLSDILTVLYKLLYYPPAYLVTKISTGTKWKLRSGQWKKIARLAEELGCDPLELWEVTEQNGLLSCDVTLNKSKIAELINLKS
ncbi:MAG: hypothetical protein RBU23_04525 [Candidatus Auribacterota bacterium]|jgi:hypothetical protein|nr:hypothetical protein [Candidatus Auribacterota bacterium]